MNNGSTGVQTSAALTWMAIGGVAGYLMGKGKSKPTYALAGAGAASLILFLKTGASALPPTPPTTTAPGTSGYIY